MADRYTITVALEGRDNLSDELRQVNQQLTQIEQNTRNTNTSVNNMENSMSSLRTGMRSANDLLGQFGMGISAMGIASAVVDLNNLGTEVRAVSTTFEQLAGGPEAAARSLENMRNLTGGVVDDMTLMSGANSLLLTGLAGTNDQAAELVNLGYRLSAAMGVDAAEGIQNLNAALLNNSFARLDTLGISAAAVRQRVAELKEEGMDMSEAFSTAVLEQGREKLELLGVAATTGETSVARLSTQFQNLKQNVAEFTASGIEAGGQLLELVGMINEFGLDNVVTAATGGTVDLEGQQRTQQIQQRADELTMGMLGIENADTSSMSPDQASSMIQTSAGFQGIDAGQLWMMQYANLTQAAQEYAQAQHVLNTAIENVTGSQGLFAEVADSASMAVGRLNRANSVEQSMLEGLNIAYDGILEKARGFQEVGGVEIMSPEQVDEIVASADLMETWFEDLSTMAEETEFQFISETELANAEAMTEEAQRLADQAERAGAAFERMSLAQMMGTGDGGRLGQMTDMVTDAIGDEGVAAQVQLELDMRSGRTSGIEQAFEDEFTATIAQIAEQAGPEAAADAAQRALEALEDGQLLGLTDEQIVESVRGAIGNVDYNRSEDAGLRLMNDQSNTLANTNIPADQFDTEEKDPMQPLQNKVGEAVMDDAITPLHALRDETNQLEAAAIAAGDAFAAMYSHITNSGVQAEGAVWAQPVGLVDFESQASGDMVGMAPVLGEGDSMGVTPTTSEEGVSPVDNLATIQEQLVLVDEQQMLVAEGISNLASTDLTGVMDPFIHGFETVNEATNVLTAKLDNIAGKRYSVQVAVDLILNDTTGIGLGNNPAFQAALGVATSNNGGVPVGTAAGATFP